MPHMHMELEEKANEKLRSYMAKKGIPSKEKAINEILKTLKV